MTTNPNTETAATTARINCGVEHRPWEGFGVYTVATKVGDVNAPLETGVIEDDATFIRCALMAAVVGLENLQQNPMHVDIVTPSTWVAEHGNDIGQLERWRGDDWKRDDGDVVPHSDLWERFIAVCRSEDGTGSHEVNFIISDDLGPKRDRESKSTARNGSAAAATANGDAVDSDAEFVADCRISYNVATLGNSGIGAYVINLDFDGRSEELSIKLEVTNYARLNLLACIDAVSTAVRQLQPRGRGISDKAQRIELATPSDYISDAVNKGWLVRWSQNGWQRNDEGRARNAELWQQFYNLAKRHEIAVRHSHDSIEVEKLGIRAREIAVKENTKLRADVEFKQAEEQDVKEGRTIRIYSDGAADPNPGTGGWGVVMEYKGKRKPQSKGYKVTTNNRMELMGAISALEQLVDLTAKGKVSAETKVIVVTDSSYVVDAMTRGWAKRWRKNKWLKQNGEKAKNTDLWNRMLRAVDRLKRVEFRWVPGHAGHPNNEAADGLATKARAQSDSDLADDEGYEANATA